MQKLTVFNNVSLDGYFTDVNNQMDFAQNPRPDPEWDAFVDGNASGGRTIMLFGRVTYEMMARFWPTPEAEAAMPVVARTMNGSPKVVFSRTLERADWSNTRLYQDDLPGVIRQLKAADGPGMIIFGSGTIVSQLTREGLIDEYQFVVVPVVLGQGRTMFEGLEKAHPMTLLESRSFKNGNVFMRYSAA
jgi:dihydrofolate reductase